MLDPDAFELARLVVDLLLRTLAVLDKLAPPPAAVAGSKLIAASSSSAAAAALAGVVDVFRSKVFASLTVKAFPPTLAWATASIEIFVSLRPNSELERDL
jgi:hypothetical protein